MSIFGDKYSFAIECQVSRVLDEQTFAHFQLWAGGQSISDYEDEIILSVCRNYLLDFLQFAGNRYEPELDEKSKEEVFNLIFNSVVYTIPTGITTLNEMMAIYNTPSDNAQTLYENVERRFHLDSFGMSSFSDKFNVILVETESGKQRLIWRVLSDIKIHEVFLEPNSFEAIAHQFLLWAES